MNRLRDRARALALVPVSRETQERLAVYENLLDRWRRVTNLVAASTWPDLWVRHFADSAQLVSLVPEARTWIDLGSGAGFPGLVVAILLADESGATVHLIESDARKAAFLREVSRETGARAQVHVGRIEAVLPTLATPDVVTARAVAPFARLLEWTAPLVEGGAKALFPKGADVDAELTRLLPNGKFQLDRVPSVTEPKASILVVSLAGRGSRAPIVKETA